MENSDLTKTILTLAERFPNPDEFISVLDRFNIPENEKGDFFLHVGIILYKHSNFKLALPVWERALTYFIKHKDVSRESNCYTNLGIAYASLGDFKKAIVYFEQALAIKREIGDVSGESSCYGNLGNAYLSLGDFRKAIEYTEQALAIKKEIGDVSGESSCYGNLGNAYLSLGDFRKAIEYTEQALAIKKEIGDVSGESSCYGNLGNAYLSLGDFRKAIEYTEQALAIKKEIGDVSGESNCYTNLGIDYQSLGDFKKAIVYQEQALAIFKEIGDVSGESNCYTNLGIDYQSLGDFKKAIVYQEQALAIFKEIGDVSGESNCYGNLGNAYRSLGDFRKAIEYFEHVLAIKKEIGDVSGESSCYGNLGIGYLSLGDFRKAIEYTEQALAIKKEISDVSGESNCYANLGIAYEELNDLDKALELLNKSVEIKEKIKQDISLEELRMLFHADTVYVYDALSFVYLRKKEKEKSVNTLDYSKNRELTDMLFCADALRVHSEYGTQFNELTERKYELKNQIDTYETWKNTIKKAKSTFTDNVSVENIRIFENGMETITREYNEVSNQIQNLYDTVSGLKPKDYNILSNALNVLEKENSWLVMEYLIMPYKSKLVVFFIDKNGPLSVSEEYDREELDSLIIRYMNAIFASKEDFNKSEEKLKKLSSEFYNVLFPGKIDEQFKKIASKVDNLMIIPHKYQLHMVPWEILFDGKEYLGLKYSISKNFSLDLAISAITKEGSSGSSALLVKNPTMDLYWADKEVDAIKEIIKEYYDPVMIGHKNATTENFINVIENRLNILHFSGHGYFAANPGLSGLVFNDKSLTANTLSGLKFKGSPIVSLSACETGITPPVRADELMGLIRGFITAGSPSIVSTNWRVNDKSACELMIEFYKNVIDNKPIGIALRNARKCVYDMHEGEILHWGAYTLYGDQFRKMHK